MADEESQSRVLVVDDERALAGVIASYLARAGYEVSQAYTGPDAVAAAETDDPDVVVLDLGLPGLDGIEVCRRIRTFSDCYILMLTARGDEVDKLIGLSVGADDYLTKPFSNRELVARVQAVLRRPRRVPAAASAEIDIEPLREFGELRIDPAGREVWVGTEPISLTRTEFDILNVISAQPKLALSRRQIIDQVWDEVWVGDEHVVDVHVANLRRKLGDDPTAPRYLATVRGVGYRMGKG
jgi:DNA-binding response OmpR family regulator